MLSGSAQSSETTFSCDCFARQPDQLAAEGSGTNEIDAHVLSIDSASSVEWIQSEVSGIKPAARCGHGSACTKEGKVFVFGGLQLAAKDWKAGEAVCQTGLLPGHGLRHLHYYWLTGEWPTAHLWATRGPLFRVG